MFDKNNGFEDAFNKYFGSTPAEEPNATVQPPDPGKRGQYTYDKYGRSETPVSMSTDIPINQVTRYLAEDNIDDIDELAELIRLILNAAWGDEWGEFSANLKHGEDPEDVTLPQITYDTVSRVIPDKRPLKPILMDQVKEIVDGVPTGDAFNLYRQWFDVVVEFNIWGRDTLEARKLMKRFETVLASYAGHLKRNGISEILFLKEDSASQSERFIPEIPMRCLLYLVTLERITTIRQSTLRRVEVAVQTRSTPGSNPDSDISKVSENIKYKL